MRKSHIWRIRKELKTAGVTAYGLIKSESRYLPHVLHEEEHVGGVVYGQVGVGSAMIVATDLRLVYLDKKPLFTNLDELAYDVVAGVQNNVVGPFATVVLHTRVRDFKVRYANPRCAHNFVTYIEKRRIERTLVNPYDGIFDYNNNHVQEINYPMDSELRDFIKERHTAMLWTVDDTGIVHNSAVHYIFTDTDQIYALAKPTAIEMQNLMANQHVTLTVYDEKTLVTAKLKGIAEAETDHRVKDSVISTIVQMRQANNGVYSVSADKPNGDSLLVLRITINQSVIINDSALPPD